MSGNLGVVFFDAFSSDLAAGSNFTALSTTVTNGLIVDDPSQLRTATTLYDGPNDLVGLGDIGIFTVSSTDTTPGDILTVKAGVYTASNPLFAMLTGPNSSVAQYQWFRVSGVDTPRSPISNVSSIPEPSHIPLLSLVAFGLFGFRLRIQQMGYV